MEYNSNIIPSFRVLYYLKQLSNNQKEFIELLIDCITHNKLLTCEFPPTLDKTFLLLSVLYSFSEIKSQKFILITKSTDKIFDLLKIFNQIDNLWTSKAIEKRGIKIIPFIEKKQQCINEQALEKSSSLDFDSFCTKITASFVTKDNLCPYFKNYKYPNTRINFEYNNINYSNIYSNEYDTTMNTLVKYKLCPFYYYFDMLTNYPEIILCTYNDYFDVKQSINIDIILNDKKNEYKIIFEEGNDLFKILTQIFTVYFDDNLLFNANIQLDNFKNFYQNKTDELLNKMNECFDDVNYFTENEIINYSKLNEYKSTYL